MAKHVLGNNPFAKPAAEPAKDKKDKPRAAVAAKPAAKKPKAKPARKKPAAPADEARTAPPQVEAGAPVSPPPDEVPPSAANGVAMPEPALETAVASVGSPAEAAPPTAERISTPPPEGDEEAGDDSYGADAAVRPPEAEPEPDYGPSLDRKVRDESARRGLVDEFRQIERFIRERVLPLAPGGAERRKLPLEFLWRRWRDIAMMDRSDFVDEFGRDPMYTARIDPVLDFLYRRYFRVEITGMEHVPSAGRALIVANHSGTLPYDGAMIMHAVKRDHPAHRDVRPLVEDFVFHFPYLGTFINRVGGVRACQENAERLLQQDQLAAVFPEGIKGVGKLYRERYRLQRFGRGGFIKLALRTDSPIIPAAIIGAEEIHPMVARVTWLAKTLGVPYLPITPTFPWLGPLGLIPMPTKWTIQFGAPLYFNAEYGAEAAEDRILVNKLAENVRSRIQEMVDAQLGKRKSVLFG